MKDIDTLWDGDVLGAFGLQSGEWIADDEIVYPDPPKSGEVRVDLPPPGYRYKPSDGELELAEVDVTCKTATPLLGAVYDARDLVVERTLVQHGSRIEMLREQLEEALAD